MTDSLPLQGIQHFRLTVTDVARSPVFYAAVLGFRVARHIPTGALLAQRSIIQGLGAAPDPAAAPAGDALPRTAWGGTT